MNDTTALVKGRNKEVAEMAKKVRKKFKGSGEERPQVVSHGNGKERRSKMIASCGFLEKELKAGSQRKSKDDKVQGEVLACKEE